MIITVCTGHTNDYTVFTGVTEKLIVMLDFMVAAEGILTGNLVIIEINSVSKEVNILFGIFKCNKKPLVSRK